MNTIYTVQTAEEQAFSKLLHEILDYDPKTGVFVWCERVGNKNFNIRHAGKIAGCQGTYGYLTIAIGRPAYWAHRLAWFYHYGVWPINDIDHADRNPLNNAISNLSDVTKGQNNRNRNTRVGKSGYRGVHRSKKRWCAQITIDGRTKYLGNYVTKEAASAAFEAAYETHTESLEFRQPPDYPQRKEDKRLTAEELRHLVVYDQLTGEVWLKRTGKRIGYTTKDGYREVQLKRRKYKVHQLAILYVSGEWPAKNMVVDHSNHLREDNAYANLRVVTQRENIKNSSRYPFSKRYIDQRNDHLWVCRISLNGEQYCRWAKSLEEIESIRLDMIEELFPDIATLEIMKFQREALAEKQRIRKLETSADNITPSPSEDHPTDSPPDDLWNHLLQAHGLLELHPW